MLLLDFLTVYLLLPYKSNTNKKVFLCTSEVGCGQSPLIYWHDSHPNFRPCMILFSDDIDNSTNITPVIHKTKNMFELNRVIMVYARKNKTFWISLIVSVLISGYISSQIYIRSLSLQKAFCCGASTDLCIYWFVHLLSFHINSVTIKGNPNTVKPESF